MEKALTYVLFLLAGGRSLRFGKGNKLLREVAGRPAVEWLFEEIAPLEGEFSSVVLVCDGGEEELLMLAQNHFARLLRAEPGELRAGSVLSALDAVADLARGFVLIHDCARVLASRELFERVMKAQREVPQAGVVPVVKPRDAELMWENERVRYLARDSLYHVQTPQSFPLERLREAFRLVPGEFPDEGSRFAAAGFPLEVVRGERTNLKLTYPEDAGLAAALLNHRRREGE